ncbi:uncharacterized protein PRCAT00002764001 [Priceomyces carsonii]|uniref:uncharacterized protein n=1 Tax=Priceomyces carsonii TaxID=28549 RepID=UPI002ED9E84E|nr:unnamed protein product [Priceomyces carsonii]
MSAMSLRSHSSRLSTCGIILNRYYGKIRRDVQFSMQHRTVEKQHRVLYRGLERDRISYNKGKIEIKPNIKHLLVQMRLEHEGKGNLAQFSNQALPNPFKISSLLEPVTFHCIIALKNVLIEDGGRNINIEHQNQRQKEILNTIVRKLIGKSDFNALKSLIEAHFNINIRQQCDLLISKYSCHDPKELEISETLELSLFSFLLVSKMGFKSQYTIEKDLVSWMSSIKASNISDSCNHLDLLYNIPAFVSSDILLRTPISKQEYVLQLDIWDEFIKSISIAYHKHTHHLKLCIKNLMFYAVQFNISKLPSITSTTLKFLLSTELGYSFKIVTEDFINLLIWQISFDYQILSCENGVEMTNIIVETQEIMVKYLAKVGSPDKKPFEKLNLRAYMGIILAIRNISPEKAEKLYHVAEKKHFLGQISGGPRDSITQSITKVFLSQSPDQLLYNFNDLATHNLHSSALWLSFIMKLNEFGLMTQERSRKILIELVKHSDKILTSKNIILHLISPIKTVDGLNKFVQILQRANYNLSVHASSILPKYLSLLYGDAAVREGGYWSNEIDSGPIQSLKNDLDPFSAFSTAVEYARYLYDVGFPRKTPKVVGIMLNGEVSFSTRNVFELYKKEYYGSSYLFPNESSLRALMRAACLVNSDHNITIWDNMYAPQIAVHEFKKQVISQFLDFSSSQLENDCKIYPSDELWHCYILMLHSFDYISELSLIIRWWEDLRFRPSRKLLLLLLRSLPKEYGKRHIQHMAKVRADSRNLISTSTLKSEQDILNWDWPDEDELRSE